MQDILFRPMRASDLIAAARLQDICYPPALRDLEPALRSRIALRDHCCLVATAGQDLVGYILAHPWPTMTPPEPDMVLAQPEGGELVHYIHDLSVDPRVRLSGLGRALVVSSQAMARASGLARSELIAIDGAVPYWQRLGYETLPIDDRVAQKVGSYGAGAAYLGRIYRAVR